MKKLNVIILAAGKGTRMHSNQPKVLHTIGGIAILQHVIHCANELKPEKIIIVYGFGGEKVKNAVKQNNIIWVEQKELKGTGHAVQQAIPYLTNDATSIILLGDVPLIQANSCHRLVNDSENSLNILTLQKSNPQGYGRIIRKDLTNLSSDVLAIVEEKDANEVERLVTEVNTGVIAMPNQSLIKWLQKLEANNAQNEYYLTDIVKFAVAESYTVKTVMLSDEFEVTGINSKRDLNLIERAYQRRLADSLLDNGVTLLDANRIDIRGELICGKDVTIDVNCIFEGKVVLGDNVVIAANCVIKDVEIAANTVISEFTHIQNAIIGEACKVGPFARIRPNTMLAGQNHIGNFVELKNVKIDIGSKVNHLSYIGDATIGSKVNIGAGTITCNYDGANKFQTIIEDGAFIGSDTQLVAPVTIGKNATIAAGSTITKNAPENQLTFCRAKDQVSKADWKRPAKILKE